MSKFVKNLIIRDMTNRLKDVDTVAVINPRGIDATKNNGIRRRLRDKGLRMMVVRNSLARKATADSDLKGFESLLEGPSAVIFGEASVSTIARLLLDEKKTEANLELRGVFFDGEVYVGEKGVEQVSKMPTREEAIGQIVGLCLSPGRNLGGALLGSGGRIASILKTIEEKAKETAGAEPAAATA